MNKRSLLILGFSIITLAANQLSVLAQTRQPTNAELKRLRQEFQQIINLMQKDKIAYGNYMRDRRTSQEKQARESFINAWSKVEPGLAPFFGGWGGYETARHIYPSNIKGRVCVIKTGEGYGSFDTGVLSNGVIKTNGGEVLFKEGNYLAPASLKNGRFVVNLVNDIPLNSPRPLEPLTKLLDYIFKSPEKNKVAQQFNAAGCTNLKPGQQSNTYIDNNCQPNHHLSQSDLFGIFYKSEFKAKSKSYWFYSGKYQDGSAIYCISQPGFKQPRPLNELKPIQFHFIKKITKDPRNKTAFLIITREGNGSYVPMIQYRLTLSTPSKPVLTKLRTWTSKD